jgi:hypothetical protein
MKEKEITETLKLKRTIIINIFYVGKKYLLDRFQNTNLEKFN